MNSSRSEKETVVIATNNQINDVLFYKNKHRFISDRLKRHSHSAIQGSDQEELNPHILYIILMFQYIFDEIT